MLDNFTVTALQLLVAHGEQRKNKILDSALCNNSWRDMYDRKIEIKLTIPFLAVWDPNGVRKISSISNTA